MKNSTVVGQVYETSDYSLFKLRKDNRPVKEVNVVALAQSIKGMGQKHPIAVTSNYVVTDGQHRLAACKKLNIPVKYIIDKNAMTTKEIAQLQSASKAWNKKDFAHSYAEDGIEAYKLYNLFVKDYPEYSHTCCLIMLANRTERSQADEIAFQEGTFKVKSFSVAKKNAETIRAMGRFYKGYNMRGFVTAILFLLGHKDFSLERLMRKLPRRSKDIMDFSKMEDYISTLTEIYNWKETKKVYFNQA